MNRITERIAWGIVGALGIAVVAVLSGVVAAGPLTPPGGPAPTQETLIFRPTGCAGFPIPLSASGSYKLAQDIWIGPCATNGINITADQVTLDLNGFTVYSLGGNATGIASVGGVSAITVKNGTVRNWQVGGIDLSTAANVVIDNVLSYQNTGPGIRVGSGARLTNCEASGNSNPATGHGIRAGTDAIIENCTASFNGADGIMLDPGGIGSVIRNCTANQNTGSGINSGHVGSTIVDCVASFNGADGIRSTAGRCLIASNEADGNGTVVTGAGVHVTAATGCRVEDNSVTNNDSGIDVDVAPGHTIFKNSARNNGGAGILDEFDDIAIGNDVGPVGTAATSTSPWANIAY